MKGQKAQNMTKVNVKHYLISTQNMQFISSSSEVQYQSSKGHLILKALQHRQTIRQMDHGTEQWTYRWTNRWTFGPTVRYTLLKQIICKKISHCIFIKWSACPSVCRSKIPFQKPQISTLLISIRSEITKNIF